jgi:hypothetical protein
LGDKFVDIEEKYDLSKSAEGFGREGGDGSEHDEPEDAVTDEEEAIGGEEEY